MPLQQRVQGPQLRHHGGAGGRQGPQHAHYGLIVLEMPYYSSAEIRREALHCLGNCPQFQRRDVGFALALGLGAAGLHCSRLAGPDHAAPSELG